MEPFISTRRHTATSRHSGRRFSLLDAMALIAAAAAGLALDCIVWFDTDVWIHGTAKDFRDLASRGFVLSAPPAAMWTVTTLALALRHPRNRLRRLLRQPGTAACAAATSALVLGVVLVIRAILGNGLVFSSARPMIMGVLPIMAGSAVTGVWGVSIPTGGFRYASDWIDRLGRLLGLYWMSSLLAVGWHLTGQ